MRVVRAPPPHYIRAKPAPPVPVPLHLIAKGPPCKAPRQAASRKREPSNNTAATRADGRGVLKTQKIPFAPNEQTRNADNYDAAVALLGAGGDKFGTRLWWDVKTDKPAW